jgi:hypothetical protein
VYELRAPFGRCAVDDALRSASGGSPVPRARGLVHDRDGIDARPGLPRAARRALHGARHSAQPRRERVLDAGHPRSRDAGSACLRAGVRTLLAGLRSAGVARIVTLPQPDWSRSPAALAFGDPAAIHARIVDANAILRDETVAAGGSYVDLFPLMESQAKIGMIAKDGLHPSADAYDAWAAELARRGMTPCV